MYHRPRPEGPGLALYPPGCQRVNASKAATGRAGRRQKGIDRSSHCLDGIRSIYRRHLVECASNLHCYLYYHRIKCASNLHYQYLVKCASSMHSYLCVRLLVSSYQVRKWYALLVTYQVRNLITLLKSYQVRNVIALLVSHRVRKLCAQLSKLLSYQVRNLITLLVTYQVRKMGAQLPMYAAACVIVLSTQRDYTHRYLLSSLTVSMYAICLQFYTYVIFFIVCGMIPRYFLS